MSWFGKHKVVTGILIVVALIVMGSIASSNNTSSNLTSAPAASDKGAQAASSQQTTTNPASQPQTLLDLSGSGTKQTQQFTAGGNWDLTWSYDCSVFGTQGNFIVTVYNSDASESFENSPVNQLGMNGSDVQHYYKGGTFYLSVNSECSWHINVKG